MKKLLSLCMILLLSTVLKACQGTFNPSIEKVYINDYVLCVDEAIGDQYNVRIRYSLKRQDGANIDPTTHFNSITNCDLKRSFGGGVQYSLSSDEKTIWIEEEMSSFQKYNSNELHTVSFENLTFGYGDNLRTIEGAWSVSFRLKINRSYKELLQHELTVPVSKDDGFYAQVSTIQLSALGIHMEMKLPDNDINRLANGFNTFLLLKNGSLIEVELHHSIRGKESPFFASGEGMFKKSLNPDEVSAIIVCGLEIPVNNL